MGGQLRTVASLVEDANLYDVADGYNAIDARIKNLKATARDTSKDVEYLTSALDRARKVQETSGSTAQVAAVLRNALGEDINTIAEAEARLEDLQSRRKESTRQAVALENERGRAVGGDPGEGGTGHQGRGGEQAQGPWARRQSGCQGREGVHRPDARPALPSSSRNSPAWRGL